MKLFNWLARMRKKKGSSCISPDAEAETMILPQNARTVDISPSLLDEVTIREFYRARAGSRDQMDDDEYDYLYTAYVQAVNPEGYARLVSVYRQMLMAQVQMLKARLVVTLPYAQYKDSYRRLGLSGDPVRAKARVKELERAYKNTLKEYEAVLGASGQELTELDELGWFSEMNKEVSMVSKYMGFGINPYKTAIGVYIGYLALMVDESNKKNER